MTRNEHLRRVAILCRLCLGNLACYRAGKRDGRLIRDDNFWVGVNGNFLDICVLEWCKLFGERKGKHHWRRVVSEADEFWSGMTGALGITEAQFGKSTEEMRAYRDKFVAHLDLERRMHIPTLDVPLRSVSYLYDYLVANEDPDGVLIDPLRDAAAVYTRFADDAATAYKGP